MVKDTTSIEWIVCAWTVLCKTEAIKLYNIQKKWDR